MRPKTNKFFAISLLLNILLFSCVSFLSLVTQREKYVSTYSESNFELIACSMTSEDVYRLLGKPFKVVVRTEGEESQTYDFQNYSFSYTDSKANEMGSTKEKEVDWVYSLNKIGPVRVVVFDAFGVFKRTKANGLLNNEILG